MGNNNLLLENMQHVLLDMLKWFHEQCIGNHLRYYVVGGTMLGAVRHNGFIPWDDDIDVAMPRKDYEEFIKIFSKRNGRYHVESPNDDNKEYTYLYAKIYDTQTTLVEHQRTEIKRGVYIDVFPLDGIGNSYDDACLNFRKIFRSIRLHDMSVCAFRKNRKWYKNLSIILGRMICPIFVSERKLSKSIRKMSIARDFDQFEYVGNLVGNWGVKEIILRKYLGTPTLYAFEGIEVYGPEDYENYLTSIYGNWRQLPPKEKQISHHDFVSLDLNKSYIEINK